jgi:hypothetical protein
MQSVFREEHTVIFFRLKEYAETRDSIKQVLSAACFTLLLTFTDLHVIIFQKIKFLKYCGI